MSFLSSWFLLCLLAFFLWYRNIGYDRIYSPLVFVMAIMLLIVYGTYAGGNTEQAGSAIFLAVWLQPIILAIAVYSYFYHNENSLYRRIAGWSIFAALILFVVALLSLFFLQYRYLIVPTTERDIWSCVSSTKTTSMFYYWGWLYLVFITFYLVLLLASGGWKDWTLVGLILLIWIIALYFRLDCRKLSTAYIFCFIGFYIWIMGSIQKW